jgi:hypothetical protein
LSKQLEKHEYKIENKMDESFDDPEGIFKSGQVEEGIE